MNCLCVASLLLGVCGFLIQTGGAVMNDGGRESNTMPRGEVMNDGGRESNTMPRGQVMNDGGRESNTMPIQCCGGRVKMSQKGLDAIVTCREELGNNVENVDALQECYGRKVGFVNNQGFIDSFPIWKDEVTQYFTSKDLNEFAGNEAAVCQYFGNQYAKDHPGKPNPATRAAKDCVVYQVQQSCEEDELYYRKKCDEQRKAKSDWFIQQYGTKP